MNNIDSMKIYSETQRLAVCATNAIEDAMEAADLSRTELAERLGIAKSRVTKVLDGESNLTLKTLAQFGLGCDVRWEFVGVKADDLSVVVTAPSYLRTKETVDLEEVLFEWSGYYHFNTGLVVKADSAPDVIPLVHVDNPLAA